MTKPRKNPRDYEVDDMAAYEVYESPIRVYLDCMKEWVNEATVTVENIEEDIQGRDVLTFKCPQCGESHRSLRVGR